MRQRKAELHNRYVAETWIDQVRISTVCLGIDHRVRLADDPRPPLLFETMIFGGRYDGAQIRCSSWDEAERMHAEAVKLVECKSSSSSCRPTTGEIHHDANRVTTVCLVCRSRRLAEARTLAWRRLTCLQCGAAMRTA